MTTTTYYNLNIVEGTDIVNPLIVDNPNYEKIDETMHDNAVAGVTIATEIANKTVHAITRENSDCAVIRFIATSEWKAGDTATVDGVPVTTLLPSGETLPDGAYVINANVLCILTGTNLTIYAERKKTENANEIAYNGTTVGAELARLGEEIDNVYSNPITAVDNATIGMTDWSTITNNAIECKLSLYVIMSVTGTNQIINFGVEKAPERISLLNVQKLSGTSTQAHAYVNTNGALIVEDANANDYLLITGSWFIKK